MVYFPIGVPDCDIHNTALLDLFTSFDASICPIMDFPPLGNSDYIVVSVSINFLSNSQQDTPLHHTAYDYSHTDIFQTCCFCVCAFCQWVQVGIDVYIPHHNYQIRLHLSPWFSAACAAAIVHRNHFFLYQQNKSPESKVKFK